MSARSILVVASMLALAGCGVDETIGDHPCPPGGTTLTYDNFGKAFIDRYCQSCHAQAGGGGGHLTSSASYGVPAGYSFGTADEVRAHKERIFARSAASNTSMPPGADDPPRAERDKLADWLACGAP